MRDEEEMMVRTAPKVEEEEEESEGHDVGDEENNGCWHQSYLQYGERVEAGGGRRLNNTVDLKKNGGGEGWKKERVHKEG